MCIVKFILKIILVLLTVKSIVGSERSIPFLESLTIDDGLSQNFIYSIHQDKFGFLWIGTKDGLNRYDGLSFKVFNFSYDDTNSISSNYVTAITEDKNGNLWIGTVGGGLNFYDRIKEKFYNYSLPAKESPAATTISSLSISQYGVWVGTSSNGTYFFEFSEKKFNKIDLETEYPQIEGAESVSKLYEDEDGVLWIATNGGGLFTYDPAIKKNERYKFDELSSDNRINRTYTLAFSDSLLWVGNRIGLIKIDPRNNNQSLITLKQSNGDIARIQNIVELENSFLLTSDNSIFVFDPNSQQYEEIYYNAEQVFSSASFLDKTNIVWLGTIGWGILKYDLKKQVFHRSKGNFLSFAYPKLMKVLNRNFEINLETDRASFFNSVLKDSKGNYWASVRNQTIVKVDSNYNIVKVINPDLFPNDYEHELFGNLYEDNAGNIWFSTYAGICKIKSNDYTVTYHKIYPNVTEFDYYINGTTYQDITDIYQDDENIFWLGTPSDGLARFDPVSKDIEFLRYERNNTNSISSNFVLCIEEDPINPERYLWIGTDGGGLNRFDKYKKVFKHFGDNYNFPISVVYAILTDSNGNLWISSNSGIMKFYPPDNSFMIFDKSEGLQSNEFNRNEYLKTDDGKFIFGGVEGFNWFYPEEIQINFIPPEIVLTEIKIYNRSLRYGVPGNILTKPLGFIEEINLEHNQNMLTFRFSVLDFSAPGKNSYAYFLEGLDKHWNISNVSQEATYTNLDPGKYILKFKAANNHGVWNNDSKSIAINISPAWWQTWWFTSLSILLFFGLIVYVIKHYYSIKHKEQLREIEKKRALEEERLRISQNMHDELGAGLAKLSILLRMSREKSEKINSSKADFEKLIFATKDVESAMDEIIWSVDPKYDNLDELIIFFTNYARTYFEDTDIKLRFDFPIDIPPYPLTVEQRHQLFSIFKEALTNIMKHSSATEVELSLKIIEDFFQIIIKDNGKGFNQGGISSNRHGLQNMRTRAEKIGCKFEIHSGENKGTLIILELRK